MPVFNISDGQGNLTRMASIEVLGRMLFPKGGKDHDRFTAWSLISALAALPAEAYETGVFGPPPQSVLKDIVEAPSYEEVMVDLKRVRQEGGYAAGSILWFVLTCKHNHPSYTPSLNKAWDVLAVAWSTAKAKRASSVSSLKKSWAEFKTVAHFWAAHDIFASAKPEGGDLRTFADLMWSREEGNLFLAFLSTADSIARQASEIVPHSQKSPLVSVPDLWMPPSDLLERSPARGVDIVPAPLPPEQLALLRARRAPRRDLPPGRRS